MFNVQPFRHQHLDPSLIDNCNLGGSKQRNDKRYDGTRWRQFVWGAGWRSIFLRFRGQKMGRRSNRYADGRHCFIFTAGVSFLSAGLVVFFPSFLPFLSFALSFDAVLIWCSSMNGKSVYGSSSTIEAVVPNKSQSSSSA